MCGRKKRRGEEGGGADEADGGDGADGGEEESSLPLPSDEGRAQISVAVTSPVDLLSMTRAITSLFLLLLTLLITWAAR